MRKILANGSWFANFSRTIIFMCTVFDWICKSLIHTSNLKKHNFILSKLLGQNFQSYRCNDRKVLLPNFKTVDQAQADELHTLQVEKLEHVSDPFHKSGHLYAWVNTKYFKHTLLSQLTMCAIKCILIWKILHVYSHFVYKLTKLLTTCYMEILWGIVLCSWKKAAAYTTFLDYWRQLVPNIIVMKPQKDLCWTCQ